MSYSHSSSHPGYVTTGLIKINGAKFRFGVRFFPRVAGGWAMHPQATGAGCTRGGGGGVRRGDNSFAQPCTELCRFVGKELTGGGGCFTFSQPSLVNREYHVASGEAPSGKGRKGPAGRGRVTQDEGNGKRGIQGDLVQVALIRGLCRGTRIIVPRIIFHP